MRDVTLLFLRRDGQVLLAMKKRGFGVGKWNGAGGKVEANETIEAATVREAQEEIGITPRNIAQVGTIEFTMSHDPAFGHRAHIFMATEWDGEPTETEEMRPQWFAETDIPYDQMWADDIIWVPLMLAGKRFAGGVVLGPDDTVVSSSLAEVV